MPKRKEESMMSVLSSFRLYLKGDFRDSSFLFLGFNAFSDQLLDGCLNPCIVYPLNDVSVIFELQEHRDPFVVFFEITFHVFVGVHVSLMSFV